ncbi:MAG: DNA polymerase [Candidatus Spechtbacterales bacterium]
MPKKDKKLFILIDSNSIFHRAYHALPRFQTQKGELVNSVYGFCLILMKALKELQPQYIAATFDVAGPTFRTEEYKEYKGTREKAPDELYAQIPRIKEVLGAFNIPIFEKQGFEADDMIGTLVETVEKNHKDIDIVVVSGDLDTLQLVSERTNVYTMKKGVQDTAVYDKKAVLERYGLTPDQLIDYKGLRGDPSDNIPGVPGVGEKTASTLLQEHKTIEKLYDALEKNEEIKGITPRIKNILLENKEQAFFSRMLATIKKDVPIDFKIKEAEWGGFNPKDVEDLFRELNFIALIKRLVELEGFEPTDNQQPTTDGEQQTTQREGELLDEVEAAQDAGILSEELYKTEKDLIPVIVDMEERGIAIDKDVLSELQSELKEKLNNIEKSIFKEAGEEFNVNSPQQLSEVLFEKLEISTAGLKKTPGKKVSTAAGELEKIKGEHPVIDLILEQRELQKLLSTYITPLPELADENNRIHTTFKPLGTSTGRLSSTHPNMQNIPIRGEMATRIRNAFVAAEGNKFLACDYSQMELRIAAHLGEDENMKEAFMKGEDIHVSTAALVFGVEKENVTKEMRYKAKALNFGIIYGMGPRAFARSAEISFEEAEDFISKYMDVFEGVAGYIKDSQEKAHQLGYAETLFGRKRYLPDLHSPNPMLRSMAERAAINMPIQGTNADIVKFAMVKAHKELENAGLILQIHDELLWECGNDTILDIAPRAKNLLESIVELSVPLQVDCRVGDSWGDLKDIDA